MRRCFIPIIFLFSGFGYASEPYIYEDGSYKFQANDILECQTLGSSNPQMYKCQNHFKNFAQNKMNKTYDELARKLTRDKAELENAQAKWVEFANAQCSFEAKASEAFAKPHSAYQEMFSNCVSALSLYRAEYLEKIDTACAGCVQ